MISFVFGSFSEVEDPSNFFMDTFYYLVKLKYVSIEDNKLSITTTTTTTSTTTSTTTLLNNSSCHLCFDILWSGELQIAVLYVSWRWFHVFSVGKIVKWNFKFIFCCWVKNKIGIRPVSRKWVFSITYAISKEAICLD